MTREQLRTASDELRKASEAADDGDLVERLHDQSNQFAQLATADTGPDHGRLARHLNALSEMRTAASDDVVEHIDAAEEAITAYRKTVDGV
jgi:tRNA A22 N-methylase